uniref:COesterase domain-containing protein n=1 Tax=Parastrongyloides trichosuri TaxID=131310 RepID=A0A0N4ZSC7_PARTI
MRILKILCYFSCCYILISGNVRTETKYGFIEGFEYKSELGKKYDVYLGIPYAKPPVGELRFEKPEEPNKWNETLDTKKYGAQCLQLTREDIFLETKEDCLFLNIIQPKVDNKKLPVLVWIHGGGYSLGSSNIYDYKNLIESFASQEIIMVTLNYRLGILGFPSLGDNTMPGNYGYWDQQLALKFIYDNIGNFNGDQTKLTIFGLSAGSGSVGALSISPHSRDYIFQAIQMSGSTLSNWALGNDIVINSTKEVAYSLNCHDNIKKCLKTKTVDDFLDGIENVGSSYNDISLLKFKPTLDNDFFPKNVDKLMEESPKIPTYIGFTDQEGLFFTLLGLSKSINSIYVNETEFKDFDKDKFIEKIKKYVATKQRYDDNYINVAEEISTFYIKQAEKVEPEINYRTYLTAYTQLSSDLIISIASLWEAEMKVKYGWPVWLYYNTYFNPVQYKANLPAQGATHANEYPYMFKINIFGKFEWNDRDVLYYNNLVKSIGNFVKYGSPSTETFEWKQMSVNNNYLIMNDQPEMKINLLQKTSDFWKSLRDKYNYDIVTDTPYNYKVNDEL